MKHAMSAELARWIANERAKRFLAIGCLVTVVATGWIVLGARTGRIAEGRCEVRQLPDGKSCEIALTTSAGEEKTSRPAPCDFLVAKARADLGARTRCFYPVNFPAFLQDVYFEPRSFSPIGPDRLGLQALGVALIVIGVRLRLRARSPKSASNPPVGPYREAASRPREDEPSPLAIGLTRSTGVLGWIFGTPFIVLGLAIMGLLLVLASNWTGEIGIGGVAVFVLGGLVTFGGLLGIGRRSGIVVDRATGILSTWWGLWRPWFWRHHSIASIARGHVQVQPGRGGTTWRTLHIGFDSGKWRRIDCADPEDVAAKINAAIGAT
jgi:hypothetical protein